MNDEEIGKKDSTTKLITSGLKVKSVVNILLNTLDNKKKYSIIFKIRELKTRDKNLEDSLEKLKSGDEHEK